MRSGVAKNCPLARWRGRGSVIVRALEEVLFQESLVLNRNLGRCQEVASGTRDTNVHVKVAWKPDTVTFASAAKTLGIGAGSPIHDTCSIRLILTTFTSLPKAHTPPAQLPDISLTDPIFKTIRG